MIDEVRHEKPPFIRLMGNLGLEPDPWQARVLEGEHHRLLLNCCRQAGKSTVVAVLSLLEAIWNWRTLVLLLAPSHRQSKLLFGQVVFYHNLLGNIALKRGTSDELEFDNLSKIVALPCSGETIRGYSNVSLLVIDEAARVPDDLFRAVLPMLSVSNGRLICLSTPFGKRGFFYDAWARGGPAWERIEVRARQVSRIKPEVVEEYRRLFGEAACRQEYDCAFESVEGLVYPEFARQVADGRPEQRKVAVAYGKKVGGIDFGLRNPFAAVWGVLDYDGVLWLTGEHYSREKSLAYHAERLPKDVTWYADPSGAQQIVDLRCAGLTVRKAPNKLDPGIGAVRARLESGRLRVVGGRCPNLLAEAELYRYDPEQPGSEKPLKENDHALDALRYLVSRLDSGKTAIWKRCLGINEDGVSPPERPAPPRRRKWLSYHNEALWTPIGTFSKYPAPQDADAEGAAFAGFLQQMHRSGNPGPQTKG